MMLKVERSISFVCVLVSLGLNVVAGPDDKKPLYSNDFEQAALNTVPADLMVLDGGFTVKEEGGNKFLELPGDPLDSFTVLFGPTENENILASARFLGTATGRRYPTFALGLNGASGYRLQVSPAKKALELIRDDEVKTSVPFPWTPGHWTVLQLRVRKAGSGWKIEGKAWLQDKAEPAAPMVSIEEQKELSAGRAVLNASPFSGTPIRFDDLKVVRMAAD